MIERILIAPGTYLNYFETDKFKCNYLSVNFMSKLDKATAASYALIPRILTRSCEKYPDPKALNRRFDELYSSEIDPKLGKNGDVQNFGLDCSFIRNEYVPGNCDILSGVIELFDEMLFRPRLTNGVFDPEDVDIEKTNLKEKIASKLNQKMRYALSRASSIMFENEVYGIEPTGDIPEVEAITPESLYSLYKKVLSELPVEIYFIGTCDKYDLTEKLKNMFSQRTVCSEPDLGTEIVRKAGAVKSATETQSINQGNLVIGFRTGRTLSDDHYEYTSLLNNIFGGSATSKLFMNVREKMSLCYTCWSFIRLLKGVIFAASTIHQENEEKAREAILSQLDSIKSGNVSVIELENAKLSLINSCRSIYDSPEAIETWYISRRLAGITEDPEDLIEKIRKASVSDVVAAAKDVTPDTIYFLKPTAEEEQTDNG